MLANQPPSVCLEAGGFRRGCGLALVPYQFSHVDRAPKHDLRLRDLACHPLALDREFTTLPLVVRMDHRRHGNAECEQRHHGQDNATTKQRRTPEAAHGREHGG